jgi:hypothetical protein
MRWLRVGLITLGVLGAVAVAGLLFLRGLIGVWDYETARSEVERLYERAGHESPRVSRCRTATHEDVDSPTPDVFVCTVETRGCTRSFVFSVPRAYDEGWLDQTTLPRTARTTAVHSQSLYKPCAADTSPTPY